ncbi:hypothetical protein [Streptomyces collinus]|uniref:hypothetical protein n=1 Tax=Streptomyces collinus TaxID=42684 RepID=UPI001ED9A066|nr:hypothetical protein [Streptomyces collinus]
MPADFPPWPRVYASFARWRDTGLATELHDRLREAVRRIRWRKTRSAASRALSARRVLGRLKRAPSAALRWR